MDRLRLLAVDRDDLAIISAHCQDAVVKLKDCRYHPAQRQFTIEMNRFVWETAEGTSRFRLFRKAEYERRRAVLHFDRIVGVKHSRLDLSAGDQVLVLLTLGFTEGEDPSGTVELVFAGGSAIRLEAEVIEAQLTDVGGAWSTEARPDHERGEA